MLRLSRQPFETAFTGGVFVAAGDINRDGFSEIVVTPDQGGGPIVAVDNGKDIGLGRAVELARFYGIQDSNFRGGARAAVGDVNRDGVQDLVVSAGFQGGPRIEVWSGTAVLNGQTGPNDQPLANFFTFEDTLRNGAFVAVGDVNGDGFGDLIFGGGPSGGPRVRIADGAKLMTAGNIDMAFATTTSGKPSAFTSPNVTANERSPTAKSRWAANVGVVAPAAVGTKQFPGIPFAVTISAAHR